MGVVREDGIVSGMAGRYASALFDLARDAGTIEAVAADLQTFEAMVASSDDLRRLVRSPAFSATDQRRALDAILARAGIGATTANFIRVVATKRRLFALPDMIAGFRNLADARKGVTRAQVTVAEPLSEARLAELREAIVGRTPGGSVDMDVRVDPAIIGGLVVQIGSRMVDGSVRTKLNAIRTRMKEVG